MITLVISVEFADDSDFEFLRMRCVDAVEDVVDIFTNGRDDEPARADGTVEVSWDTQQ